MNEDEEMKKLVVSLINPNILYYNLPILISDLLSMKTNRKFILDHPDLDLELTDSQGNTALFIALQYKMTEVVERLLKLGANINHINSNGNSPLHQAIQFPSCIP